MAFFKYALFLSCLLSGGLLAQVADPVPDVQPSALTFGLEPFVTVPNTNSGLPRARINLLRELPDGSGRLFVNDLNGPGHLILGDSVVEYLDLREEFPPFIDGPGKGTGFGAFAFHPEFGRNGKFYTTHAEQTGSGPVDFAPEFFGQIEMEWVLVEWTASDPAANAFSGTRRELLRFSFPHFIHGLQDLSFNPTAAPGSPDYGLLYLCVGEGGSMQRGFTGNLQHPMAYQGTIFRLDPAGTNAANGQYGIPADNPYAQDSSALGEVWCSGFRNPHRLAWDPEGGPKVLVGDIGEANIEEVNLAVAGGNYGWHTREGTFEFRGQSQRGDVFSLPAQDSGYLYPVAQYDHDDGPAIVGGYVYRGTALPELDGQYICGDIVNGRLFHAPVDSLVQGRQFPLQEIQIVDENGQPSSLVDAVVGTRMDLRFGQDAAGQVYLLTKADGTIRRLVSTQASHRQDWPAPLQGTWGPNPATDHVRWQGTAAEAPGLHFELWGLDGRRYLAGQGPQVDLSVLPTGVYLLRWQGGRVQPGYQLIRKD